MAVNVAGTEDLTFGVPRLLFDTRLVVSPFADHFRAAPDGQRFLLKVPVGGTTSAPITAVLNWTALLP